MGTLFYNPLTLPAGAVLWMVIPLCFAVVLVYKTIRVEHLRKLPLQVGLLTVYVLAGLAGLGVLLHLIQAYWP